VIPALLTAISRHYIDLYAGLLPFAVGTLLALTTVSGSLHCLAAWSAGSIAGAGTGVISLIRRRPLRGWVR